jgi:hypothetical protein
MTYWHRQAVSTAPIGDGFDLEGNEFDWEDDDGICYDQHGVTVRHWRRIHGMAGPSTSSTPTTTQPGTWSTRSSGGSGWSPACRDHNTIGEAIAGVRTHRDGLFALGAPDGIVVNRTKGAIWTRPGRVTRGCQPAARHGRRAGRGLRRQTAHCGRAAQEQVTDLVDRKTLAKAIPSDRFVPADVDRPHRRKFPSALTGQPRPLATEACAPRCAQCP